MDITQAVPTDTDSIMALIRLAVAEMQRQGIFQWDEHYPNREIIAEDIAADSLYKIHTGGDIAGIIVLNENQSPEYATLSWRDSNGKPLCVHRVCIHPAFQREGLARRLMLFAESYAKKNNYSSIRLDTFSKNPFAQRLYDSLEYKRTGIVSFRKGDFYCYEKLIN
jgi:ribosomal protein S18 acetylase RimI-like enzyme